MKSVKISQLSAADFRIIIDDWHSLPCFWTSLYHFTNLHRRRGGFYYIQFKAEVAELQIRSPLLRKSTSSSYLFFGSFYIINFVLGFSKGERVLNVKGDGQWRNVL